MQVYFWTLAQREATPCVPLLLAVRCNNESHCAGLGDRLISLGSAFWLVRRFDWSPIRTSPSTHFDRNLYLTTLITTMIVRAKFCAAPLQQIAAAARADTASTAPTAAAKLLC